MNGLNQFKHKPGKTRACDSQQRFENHLERGKGQLFLFLVNNHLALRSMVAVIRQAGVISASTYQYLLSGITVCYSSCYLNSCS